MSLKKEVSALMRSKRELSSVQPWLFEDSVVPMRLKVVREELSSKVFPRMDTSLMETAYQRTTRHWNMVPGALITCVGFGKFG